MSALFSAPGGSRLVVRRETASQTAGPYVHIGLAPEAAGFDIFEKNFGSVLVGDKTKGEKIRIEGRVFDGIGTVLKDVLIEIWQANAEGKYAHPADRQPGKSIDPAFRGWGRACTDFETGVYAHADEWETSLYLHFDRERVQMDKAVKDSDRVGKTMTSDSTTQVRFNDYWGRWTKTGVHGDPTKATPEKGKKILEIVLKHMMMWLDEYRVWPIDARSDQHRLPVPKGIRW